MPVCVWECVYVCVPLCVHAHVCVYVRTCVCVCVCVCEDEGVYMFQSPRSIITIIFLFTSAPVNDDVWELHTWVRRLHVSSHVGLGVEICEGSWMHTSSSSRTQHRNTGAYKREKVLTAREFLESLAKVPSHYCRKDSHKLYLETVILQAPIWTYGICNTSRMVRWATRSTTLTSGDPYHKDRERTKLMTTRAPSGSIFSSWRKYCPKTTITIMMYCFMETGYWTQELCQFWFQGVLPGHQRNMLSNLRIRTCMVLSHD